ncbi:MAG: hypothetical protein ACYDHP_04530 [Ferrimicrobium sp.]
MNTNPTGPSRSCMRFSTLLACLRMAMPVLGVYLAVRLGLLLADILAAHIGYGGNVSAPMMSWDSHFYVAIARNGYPVVSPVANGRLVYASGAFEPVFPALIYGAMSIGLSPVMATWTVSFLAGALTALVVWRLGTALVGEPAGLNAVVLFAVFPGMSVSWGLFYAECVGLGLVAGSLLLMLRKRWVLAGVLGALATATSPLALPLVAGPIVVIVQAIRRRQVSGALWSLLLVPLGFVGYAAWLGVHYHDPLFWWHLQHEAWGATVDFGASFATILRHPWTGNALGKGWLEWAGITAVVGGLIALWRARLPALINAYVLGVVALLLVSNQLGFKPRLLSWAFPVFIALAATLPGRWRQILIVLFAVLLPVTFFGYVLLGNTVIQP